MHTQQQNQSQTQLNPQVAGGLVDDEYMSDSSSHVADNGDGDGDDDGGGDGGGSEGGDNDDEEVQEEEHEDSDDDEGDVDGVGASMTQRPYSGGGTSQRPLNPFTREDTFDHAIQDTHHGSRVPHFQSYYKRRGEIKGWRFGKTKRHQEGECSSSHHTADTLAGSFDSISLSGAFFQQYPHPQFTQYPQFTSSSSTQNQKESWIDSIFTFGPG